jgi:hypothetical protein
MNQSSALGKETRLVAVALAFLPFPKQDSSLIHSSLLLQSIIIDERY